MAQNVAPEALVKEAQEVLELFRRSWRRMKEGYLEFGRACTLLEGRELYKYIRKGKSKQGYLSFDELVDAETGGDCSRSMIFEAKRVYKLTLGPDAVPREAVLKMPRKNQLRVAKALHDVEQMPAEARAELIEKAQSQDTMKFAATAQHIVNEQLPVEKQGVALVRFSLMLNPTVAEKFKNLIEDFKLTPVVRQVMRDLDMTSAAVQGIIDAAHSWADEHLIAAKEKAKREAPEINPAPQAASAFTEAYTAPDAAQAIATAETERRVIKRQPEADSVLN